MHRSGRRSVAAAGLMALAVLVLAGCGATPRPDLKSAPAVTVVVRVPDDGIALSGYGLRNGPATALTVPRGALLTTSVDEPTGVTLVFSRPGPRELAGYLRRTLPSTGFTITADNPGTSTLTFTGYGWHGSFTGTQSTSAIILRP